MPGLPREIVLYLSDKRGIIKPWAIILWLRRFDLVFWQTSKQIYAKLQCKQKVFEEFQGLSCFPRKMVSHSSTEFPIIKPWRNIPLPRKFHLGFWQTWKQIYMKLKYRENAFGEFQDFSHSPRKMVLYSLTKFGIVKPWTNIPWLWRFDLGFWVISKQIYKKLLFKEKILESSKVCLVFPEKWCCIRWLNLTLKQ